MTYQPNTEDGIVDTEYIFDQNHHLVQYYLYTSNLKSYEVHSSSICAPNQPLVPALPLNQDSKPQSVYSIIQWPEELMHLAANHTQNVYLDALFKTKLTEFYESQNKTAGEVAELIHFFDELQLDTPHQMEPFQA